MAKKSEERRGRKLGSGRGFATTVSVRIDDTTVDLLDRFVAKKQAEFPSAIVSRATVTREALVKLLAPEKP